MQAAPEVSTLDASRHRPSRAFVLFTIPATVRPGGFGGEETMRSILAFVVAAFVTILLAGAPAATKDLCNGGQPACQLQADTPFKMAAEMPTPPKASRPAGAA